MVRLPIIILFLPHQLRPYYKKSRYSFSNHGISPFRLLILYLLSFLIFINNLSYYVHFSTQTAYCPEYLKAYHSKIYCRFHKIQ